MMLMGWLVLRAPVLVADDTYHFDNYMLPAQTVVHQRITEEISTRKRKPGEHFGFELLEDVRVADVVLIRKGSMGDGEIVHADRSHMGGKAGELILAARFLDARGTRIRLRSLVVGPGPGGQGKDRTNQSMVTSIIAGPFGLFVHGGEIVIPPGTEATAKTAEEVRLPPLPTIESSSNSVNPQGADSP